MAGIKRLKCKICGFLTSNSKISQLDKELGLSADEVAMARLQEHYIFKHEEIYDQIMDFSKNKKEE